MRRIARFAAVLLWLICANWGCAESPVFRRVTPRELGLDIPSGSVESGGNACVLVPGKEGGQDVVARIWVRVGEQCIVLLPTGELAARSAAQTQPTEQRFEACSADELLALLAARLPGHKLKKGRHYVYAYNTGEAFARAAQGLLESMVPGIVSHSRQQKLDTQDPEFPLVAIMFRTRQEFDAFRPMPDGIVAYYDPIANHVVMYEESPLYRVKPELAMQQAISTIAHEGAHQILHNIGVQQRLSVWPMWLSEGLAEYYAPTGFGKKLRWKGAGHVNDLRMFELELYLKGRTADAPDGQMVEHTVSAARLTSTGYAAAWSLTHFLAKTQRDEFHAFLGHISRMGPLETCGEAVSPGVVPANLQTFRDHFGVELTQIESRLVKHLKSLPYTDPFQEWPHFVATVEVPLSRRSRRDAQLFHSRDMAEKWTAEAIAALPESQRRQARPAIEPFPNRLQAERYARQFLSAGR
ncbi:MAG: DUF1570 domain-containing protein [Pirellulaceae bacterium]